MAYHAKPVVAAAAGAAIAHNDLTALLYLQGYTRDEAEIVEGRAASGEVPKQGFNARLVRRRHISATRRRG